MHPSDYTFRESQDAQRKMHQFEEDRRFDSFDAPPPNTPAVIAEAQSVEEVGDGMPLTPSDISKLEERYFPSRKAILQERESEF